jgi:uncharacterized protein involved in exopolysaccharide biosynthesis
MAVEPERGSRTAVRERVIPADGGGSAGEKSDALDARLARVNAERDALRARLAEAEQRLATLPALLADREELDALRSSLSWRATAPLRRAEERVRRELVPNARLAAKRTALRIGRRLRD